VTDFNSSLKLTNFGIVLQRGPYQTQRWETAYRIAEAALRRSDEVVIFLYMDGVYNALSTESFPFSKELPKDDFESLLNRGAHIYACETCTNNRGLEEGKDYIKRVEIRGATEASEMVSKCDRIINL
jgi:tRNA 2-thiouridine synthesizing protein D